MGLCFLNFSTRSAQLQASHCLVKLFYCLMFCSYLPSWVCYTPHLAGWQRSPSVDLQGVDSGARLCHQLYSPLPSSTCPSSFPSRCPSARWQGHSECHRLLPTGSRDRGVRKCEVSCSGIQAQELKPAGITWCTFEGQNNVKSTT